MGSSVRLLRVRGIEIGANWSWFLIFGVIIWSLATGFFPSAYEGLSPATYWVMGVTTSVLFIVSLVLHELGHAFRAQKEGMVIEGITLWIAGGVAKFKGMFPSAGAEFRIAIAGPVVTAVLIPVFFGITAGLDSLGAPDAVLGVTSYLGQINLLLLVFNMIPGLPLDGGRVLRSFLWQRSGNFTSATLAAARVARVFAWFMIGAGALLSFGTGSFGFLWYAFIGMFLMQAAQAEVNYALFRQSVRGMSVENLMTPNPVAVDPDMTIDGFIEEVAHMRGFSTYPVVYGGRLAGLVTLRLAAGVPLEARPTTRVRDVMIGADDVPTIGRDADVIDVAQTMQAGGGRALVVDDGHVVGILSMSDVARALELEQIRHPGVADPKADRASRRLSWFVLLPFLVAGLAAIAYLYSPPFVTFAPGKAFDVSRDITIEGLDTTAVDGKYMLTSVAVQQPNVFGLIAAIAQGKDLIALSAVVPGDVDPEEYFEQQEALFEESQNIAAAAAAKAAGMEVELTGKGAEVGSVTPNSPAEGKLEAGDVIVAIDDDRIRLADDVVRTIRSRPDGTRFTLGIERDGEERDVIVESRSGIVRGAPGIGVLLETKDFEVDLPFEIEFRKREIGGPSAGLAYAMAVYDLLESANIAGGRDIATTGTIDLEGKVGPIGGVEDKAIAAQRAGAELFLVPEAEVGAVEGAQDLKVLGVSTLQDAVESLG